MTDILPRISEALLSSSEARRDETLDAACIEIERLRRRVVVLEMVISQECDGDFCCDDLNRMIVDDIRNRPRPLASVSRSRGAE